MMKFWHSFTLACGKQPQLIYLHEISNSSCMKSTDCSLLCRIRALFLLHFIKYYYLLIAILILLFKLPNKTLNVLPVVINSKIRQVNKLRHHVFT